MPLSLLWLTPILPFAGFLVLILFGARMPRVLAGIVGVGSVGASAVLAIGIAAGFLSAPPAGNVFTQTLWTWINIGTFTPGITLTLDPLALIFLLIVTVVGFLIHLYSAGFMAEDEGFHRFFAYMNLFVGSMLLLVLAGNLLLLYLGWEGVGLCSYFLIGFWYKEPANGYAAMKAFIVTRIGDVALIIALFLLYFNLGSLDISTLLTTAGFLWSPGSVLAAAAAALLLGGAVGKSAQLPLQVWLPDAMAGPTPVSALIHAATMVTAGVYLIARMHVIFTLAPVVMTLVAIIGAVTLLLAGFSALAQHDLKRVLAYSTISQIGYMFLALGVGAWSAAIFHFFTHAFFKALLFLAAGVVIQACHEEHDMEKMGGLRKSMPLVFWTFLIGALSLSALPLVTAGFYSKDAIISAAWSSALGNPWLWAAGWVGALLTGLYTFRMVFLTFFGAEKIHPVKQPGWLMGLPLVLLAVPSVIAGFIETPHPWFSDFLRAVLPATVESSGAGVALQILSAVASLAGIGVAYQYFLRRPQRGQAIAHSPAGNALGRFWLAGWGFDWGYDRLFVRPFVWIAHVNRDDVLDGLYRGTAALNVALHRAFSRTQTGQVRWYAAGLAIGAIILLALMVLR